MREFSIMKRWLLVAILVLLVANIAVSNNQIVTFNFWPFGAIDVPLWFVLICGVTIGLVMGVVMFFVRLLAMEIKTFRMQSKLKKLEKSVETQDKKIRQLLSHDDSSSEEGDD